MSRWHEERRRDPYHRQARKEGYRARSAFKLQQINNKFKLIKRGQAVADLGCAPGGWSQVLVELTGGPGEGVVIGVDLLGVRPIEGAKFLRGDFTKRALHVALAKLMQDQGREQLDVVVSDMAPDMSGTYDLDQARSVHLCTMALNFAKRHLADDGNFCCKIFEGADFQEFREELRACFRKVQQFHPPASRKASSEVYLIAHGFKGPRLDPL